MFALKIETIDKNVIRLTQDEDNYQVLKVDGLNPSSANINTSGVSGMDGSIFNSSKLENRNIVITIKICGDIEENRLKLYKYFKNKQYCKIYYQNNSRNVYAEGYVEAFEVNPFVNPQIAQISIICPDPYFKDLNEIIDDISKIVAKFSFPFSINIGEPVPISTLELDRITEIINNSEADTWMTIHCVFYREVKKLEIRNTVTGDSLILNYNFNREDRLKINCKRGNKYIVLIRNNVETNLIPALKKGSVFLELKPGINYFSYLADDGDKDEFVSIKFNRSNTYGGM